MFEHRNAVARLPPWSALFALVGCIAAYPATPTPFSPPVSGVVTILRNATLIDGTGAEPQPGMDVPSDVTVHDDVALAKFADGQSKALQPLFKAMARQNVILDATVWAFDAPMPDTGSPPNLAHLHCDAAMGAAITTQAYRAGVPIATGTDNPGL